MYPPSDAVYYPLYTKCCELDLPLCMNTGLPGPPIPGEAQNPIHLDRVCVRFPELKLCMMHGADPWWDVAIRLMIKYANLRLMTSAWSPRHLPESLLHYMRTRGKDRVMFASDSPVLSITEVRQGGGRARPAARGARRLPLPERPGLLLQPLTETSRWAPSNGEPTGRSSNAIPRRTSRGSRSTTPSGATRTTRRCGAPWRALPRRARDRRRHQGRHPARRDGVFSTGADMANSYAWYGPTSPTSGGRASAGASASTARASASTTSS